MGFSDLVSDAGLTGKLYLLLELDVRVESLLARRHDIPVEYKTDMS
jgi:hypothetical protein